MTRHLGAGSAHGHRMGALKDMGAVDHQNQNQNQPQPAR